MGTVSIPPSMKSINFATSGFSKSITDAAQIVKIVDYAFERKEGANILAIHPELSLIAYLIAFKKTASQSASSNAAAAAANNSMEQKQSQSVDSSFDNSISTTPQRQAQSSSSSTTTKTTTPQTVTRGVTIRVLDYVSKRRCLVKGVFHARPADCAFAINSTSSTGNTVKMAIVDRQVNVYIYNIYTANNGVSGETELRASRVVTVRSTFVMPPTISSLGTPNAVHDNNIRLAWCPYVPCDDFDAGDGGLRLAVSSNKRVEIFAIDRIETNKSIEQQGELSRHDLGPWQAYKCIEGKESVVSMSLSPECSTLAAAFANNEIKFYSADVGHTHNNGTDVDCIHSWTAHIVDSSIVSRMFFLDDYPSLLLDSTKKFWGAAIVATKTGQMQLIDLRTWSVYQTVSFIIETGARNFDYQIDSTSNFMVAVNGNKAFVIHFDLGNGNDSHNDNIDTQHKLSTSTTGEQLLPDNQLNIGAAASNGDADMMILTNLLNGRSNTIPTSSSVHSIHEEMLKMQNIQVKPPSIDNSLPRITKITGYTLHNPAYSFALRRRSHSIDQLELYILSATSLEKYLLKIAKTSSSSLPPQSSTGVSQHSSASQAMAKAFPSHSSTTVSHTTPSARSASEVAPPPPLAKLASAAAAKTAPKLGTAQSSSVANAASAPATTLSHKFTLNTSLPPTPPSTHITSAPPMPSASTTATTTTTVANMSPEMMGEMDRLVGALFTQLNTAFSRGLEEFLGEIRAEVNNLKTRITVLSREIKKLQNQH